MVIATSPTETSTEKALKTRLVKTSYWSTEYLHDQLYSTFTLQGNKVDSQMIQKSGNHCHND